MELFDSLNSKVTVTQASFYSNKKKKQFIKNTNSSYHMLQPMELNLYYFWMKADKPYFLQHSYFF